MEVGILRIIFFALFIGAAYLILKLISKLSDGKVKADFFAAVNLFLYFALILNIGFSFYVPFTLITAAVILFALYTRKKSADRWI